MSSGEVEQQGGGEAAESASLLDQVLTQTPNVQADEAKQLYSSLVEEALKGTCTWDKDVTRTIQGAMENIDRAVSEQLSAIMHNPRFQKLEGSWRGLNYLVMNSETSTTAKKSTKEEK